MYTIFIIFYYTLRKIKYKNLNIQNIQNMQK